MSRIRRPAHSLRREKTLAIPREVIFFDTETKQEGLPNGDIRQTLKLGWACYYRRPYGRHKSRVSFSEFFNSDSFWRFVFARATTKQRLWVISHNLNFDFTVVGGFRRLKDAGYRLKFFHNSGTTCIISVTSKHGSIVFVDFMNWFPESLAKIGARIGIPKLNIDLFNCSDSELSIYCKRDVEILLAAFKDFVSFLTSRNIARLCYTRASTSMAAYMLNYYRHKIFIHNNREAIDLERASYRGGRTEAFFIGDLNNVHYYILDVNSLYPSVMANTPYPVKYKQTTHGLDPTRLLNILKRHSVVARVLVETDEPAYGVKQERTIFPVGRFWVTLCTPELKYAIEHGHLLKVDRAVIYKQADIFTGYVKRFYTLRQEFKKAGQLSYEQFCKYFLNSLYGKFGQKAEIWTKIGVAPDEPDRTEMVVYPDQNRRGLVMYLMGEIFELTGFEEAYNSFPAISSHVTAYGRMHLWRLMKTAGKGNYFYCDTDSLIVNEVGLCRLKEHLHETELGALKLQEKTSTLSIRGLKDYQIDSKNVIKGIRRTAKCVNDTTYEQERWPSLRGMLRAACTESYVVHKQIKTLNRKYTKGIVTDTGIVEPLVLDVAC